MHEQSENKEQIFSSEEDEGGPEAQIIRLIDEIDQKFLEIKRILAEKVHGNKEAVQE